MSRRLIAAISTLLKVYSCKTDYIQKMTYRVHQALWGSCSQLLFNLTPPNVMSTQTNIVASGCTLNWSLSKFQHWTFGRHTGAGRGNIYSSLFTIHHGRISCNCDDGWNFVSFCQLTPEFTKLQNCVSQASINWLRSRGSGTASSVLFHCYSAGGDTAALRALPRISSYYAQQLPLLFASSGSRL